MTNEEARKLEQEIANELSIPQEVVRYIRPRLLGDFYNMDARKLWMRVEDHISNAKLDLESKKASVTKSLDKAEKFPKQAQFHKKRAKVTMEDIEKIERMLTLYPIIMSVLEKPEKVKVIVRKYES